MADKSFEEKRKFIRLLIGIPLKYAKMNLADFSTGETYDISSRGLGIITTEEFAVNTPINLSLQIPDNAEEIPLQAEVVWSERLDDQRYRSGLKIKNIQIKPIPLVLRTISSRL